MSGVTIPEIAIGSEPVPSPLAKPRGRLLALDIFRGMTLIAMVLVNMPGDERFTYAAISHVKWDGWSIADLIFPFFIFIVGVAMPYSFAKRLARGDSNAKLFAHIVARASVLFGVGIFMTWYYNYMGGFMRYHLSNIRLFGALQRIGLCYLIAAPLYLKVKPRGLAIISATILVLYFILLKFVPVPGLGVPTLANVGNWVSYVDLHITPHHLGMRNDIWEPKGWLGTLPAVATMLIGVLAGLYLRSARSAMEKVRTFLVVGNIGIVLGLIWSVWIPINQNLWTSSMVVFMCGMALVILGCCYYVADMRKITWWTKPFIIVGVNSLFLWVMAGTTDSVFNLELIKVHLADGTRAPLPEVVARFFATWIGPTNGSELYAALWMALWLGILTLMYKKRIIVKI
jgi:predicted acyltransferase